VFFSAHRCILAARSQYFDKLLHSRWMNKSTISLSHKLVGCLLACFSVFTIWFTLLFNEQLLPQAFQAVLQYLYTARLETSIEYLEDVCRLAKHCQLESLVRQLEQKMKVVHSFGQISLLRFFGTCSGTSSCTLVGLL
jgi:ankyrin repeat/BTB/POZ domain-containing protein 1